MNSPVYRHRVRRELVDRARYLAKSRGYQVEVAASVRDCLIRFKFVYKVGPLIVRCNVDDDHVTLQHYARASGKLSTALTCGRPYRFGRVMAKHVTLMALLEILRNEMVLDDLACV